MKYSKFEKLGIETSLLGYGCMRFPTNAEGKIDRERAEKLLDTAYENGVNYFDTAYPYHNGESEEFVGAVLDKYDRSSYYLATKLPHWEIHSLEDAERIFHKQLKKLNKDYVDFYLLHAMNKGSFDKLASYGVLEYFDKMKEEGKIRYFGFSFHDNYDAFEYILKYRNWDFCQIQLNYMDTEIQQGIKGYKLAEELQVPVVVMEPVKGGTLAKLPQDVEKYFKEISPEKSAASWALRWVASLPNVKVVLSGMSDEMQVKDNLNTFRDFEPLNEAEKAAVDNAVIAYKKRVKNGCTGCNYCMPCPAGVNIPRNFKIWNEYGMYENAGSTRWQWTKDMDDKSKAKNCVECGQCEEMCPQQIQIRENLKLLQEELDLV